MTTASKIPLSGSTHGLGIKVTGTSSGAAVTVHTASATTTDGLGDHIELYAYNSDTQARTLTIEFGGTTAPDNHIKIDVPPLAGAIYVVPLLPLRNSLVVKAFADAANVIVLYGVVTRIS